LERKGIGKEKERKKRRGETKLSRWKGTRQRQRYLKEIFVTVSVNANL
jgi:hypothetical protein